MINFFNLPKELARLETQCPDSTLMIFVPGEDKEKIFHDICHLYLVSSARDRSKMKSLLDKKAGIQNNLLGYAYHCASQMKETKKSVWLRIGLAAAMLADQEMDPRDILVALAELFVVAEEAGIEPAPLFKEICSLGDFGKYAVVNSRRAGTHHVTQ